MINNLDDDLIYQGLLNTHDETELLSDAELLFFSDFSLLKQSEVVKVRLLRSKFMSLYGLSHTKEIILLLLAHTGFVTIHQLLLTRMFTNEQSARNSIASLKKDSKNGKAKLKGTTISAEQHNEKVYSLTPAGRNHIFELLPTVYIQGNNLICNDNAPTSINSHDLELLNLFYYLVGDYSFMYFKWISNVFLTPSNPIKQCLNNVGYNDKNNVIRPDAVIVSDEYKDNFLFVEHDMITERINFLTGKIEKYERYLSTLTNEYFTNYSILFTISTNNVNVPTNTTTLAKVTRTYQDLLKYMVAIEKDNINDVEKHLRQQIIKEKDKVKTIAVLNSMYQMMKFLQDTLKDNPNAQTKDDLDIYYDKSLRLIQDSRQQSEERYSKKVFERRKDVLFDAVGTVKAFKDILLKGFSVYCCDSNNLDILKYLLIKEYKSYDILIDAVKEQLKKPLIKFTYEDNYTIHNENKQVTLKNCIRLKNNSEVPFIFENISHDLGGAVRVRELVECIDDCTDLSLYLLVSDERAAIQFNSSFTPSLTKRFMLNDNPKLPKEGIRIQYIAYSSDNSNNRVFVIDNENNTIYI